MERLLTFVKLNSLQICVPWTYSNAMNFSELFKHTGSLCQFSPDGQYLVCNLMFCCPNWNFLHRFQSINLVISLYLTFLVVICISMADIGSKKEKKYSGILATPVRDMEDVIDVFSADTRRKNNISMMPKWCRDIFLTSWWCYYCVVWSLGLHPCCAP